MLKKLLILSLLFLANNNINGCSRYVLKAAEDPLDDAHTIYRAVIPKSDLELPVNIFFMQKVTAYCTSSDADSIYPQLAIFDGPAATSIFCTKTALRKEKPVILNVSKLAIASLLNDTVLVRGLLDHGEDPKK